MTPQEDLRRRLAERVRSHIVAEREMLEAYSDVDTAEEHVRYLIGLLLEEEMRHHHFLNEIAVGLLRDPADASTMTGTPPIATNEDPERLLAQTTKLAAFEADDLRELAELKRALAAAEGTELMQLMVELMVADTRKHLKILAFLGAGARSARRRHRERARAEAQGMVPRDATVQQRRAGFM
jgi:hypothetical protein